MPENQHIRTCWFFFSNEQW